MHYDHKAIEEKWRKEWRERGTYRVTGDDAKPAYYVLDMFPYPSGAGLHVGHPLGYIASDIVARHKRQQGFCVLHPMGYDAFGLPAEQYAIQTGQHPAVTTEVNIERYREQLDRIGFSFDWSREVRTSDPAYYKWTQWIFLQLFNSWYDPRKNKAEPIETLIEHFELQGYEGPEDPMLTGDIEEEIASFTATEWKQFDERTRQRILQNFRLAYLSEAWVNWCAALGTVLANDEVKDGVSERGGHPVERKRMPQWSLRMTAYAQRLLEGLDTLDWSESIKEAQRNWIGRSEGALVRFAVVGLTPDPSPVERGVGSLTPGPSPVERGVASLTPGPSPVERGVGSLTPGPSPVERGVGSLTPGPSPVERGTHPGRPVGHRYDTANRKLYEELKARARRMRKEPTAAELALWEALRGGRLGEKFRRQHVIQDFIVDFVCLERTLVVEVDGDIHDHQKDHDEYRTQQLEAHGFEVIRFTNTDVLGNRNAILDQIKEELAKRPKQAWPEGSFDPEEHDDAHSSLSTGEGRGEADSSLSSRGEGPGVRPVASSPEGTDVDNDDDLAGATHSSLSTGEGRGEAHSSGEGRSEAHSPLSTGEGLGVRPESTETIEVFTTRPDTLFGVTFVTLAPEHELVERITTPDRRAEVMAYVSTAKNRSERERQADVKRVSGVFTGACCMHPFTGRSIPVWVGDYVLSGYGTGAVMAVPGGDQRDWNFATHFELPIVAVTEGADISKEADERKDATIINSGFLSGMKVPQAITRAIEELVTVGAGERRINYRLRDAAFGRQRYWGEPIPIYYKDGVPFPVKEEHLPIVLPEIDKYQPTEDGEPPLARAKDWTYSPKNGRAPGHQDQRNPGGSGSSSPREKGLGDEGQEKGPGVRPGHFPLETTTMPGWAGSSWYFLRYMDPKNTERFAGEKEVEYWGQVDLYMGGSEHATGHLLYFRFWTKFLHDRGWIPFDEPAKKLVNQGMIQGVSQKFFSHSVRGGENRKFIEIRFSSTEDTFHRVEIPSATNHIYVSADVREADMVPVYPGNESPRNMLVSLVSNGFLLDRAAFTQFHLQDEEVIFVCKGGYWYKDSFIPFHGTPYDSKEFRTVSEVEKMSKSKFNVVNPDEIIERYGADTLRLYEMFLGPLEQSKPWDTNGIEGTSRFLRKFWNLFHDEKGEWAVTNEEPTKAELKVLHATIRKVTDDIERMSFNTSVSQFMIAANQLGELKCRKRAILTPLAIVLSPFAPHITEELWQLLGNTESITTAQWPQHDEAHLVEDSFSYPISFNGKTRLQLEFPIGLSKTEVEAAVLANPEVQQRLEGRAPKKVIVVPKRIVNIVL